MYDRYNRRITYLRISVTDRCNLRCSYCVPACGVRSLEYHEILSFEQITEIATAAVGMGIEKIRLTGGEPLVRKGIVQLVGQLATIPGLRVLGMTTNGLLLRRYATGLRTAGLDSINISLDTLDPVRFHALTRGGRIEDAIAGVDAAVAAGFAPIKINAVVDDQTDSADVQRLREFCLERGVQLQRIGRYRLDTAKPTYERLERPPRCSVCNRLRLTADGKLKPCLHSNVEIPIDFRDIEDAICRAVSAKPAEGTVCTNRAMSAIGG